MIDTHCHLNLEPLSNTPSKFLDQALAAGVPNIIIPAVDLPTSQSAIDLAGTSDRLFAMVGIHPEEAAKTDFSNLFENLKSLALKPKVVAIGECGLDYFHTTQLFWLCPHQCPPQVNSSGAFLPCLCQQHTP